MADDVFEKFVGFFCVCTIVSVLYVMDNEGKKGAAGSALHGSQLHRSSTVACPSHIRTHTVALVENAWDLLLLLWVHS